MVRRLVRWPAPQRILPLLSLALIICGFVLFWLQGVQRPYIDNDFSYSANIVATDSAYDQLNQRYAGDRYSRGKVNYTVDTLNPGHAILGETVDVTTVEGQPLAHIERHVAANPQTGRYVSEADAGYVFAPRKLHAGQNFTYRHLAYDAPATMHYAGQETLYGLTVFRYAASYPPGLHIYDNDAAASLPAGQRLEWHPQLQVWVEPTTGWLVKFVDTGELTLDTTQTGTVMPFDKYSTYYTENSVSQQAAYAKNLKQQMDFDTQIAPCCIVIIVLGLVLWLVLRRIKLVPMPVRFLVGLAFVLGGAVACGWIFGASPFAALFSRHSVNPLADVAFMLSAICIALLYWRRWRWLQIGLAAAVTVAAVVAVLAGSKYVPQPAGVSPDTLGGHRIERISLYTAGTFLLLSFGLLQAAWGRRQRELRAASLAAGMVAILGLLGWLMQFLQANQAFALSVVSPLSATTCGFFVLSGLTLIAVIETLRQPLVNVLVIVRRLVQPALLGVPLVLIGTIGQFRQNVIQQQLAAQFITQTTTVQDTLTDRLNLYTSLLVGAQGLFAASQQVTAGEWHAFVGAYNIQAHFPGLVNVGFARSLSADAVPQFTAQQKAAGMPITVQPASALSIATPIVYLDSQANDSTYRGYDMFSDSVRATAMQQARDSGSASLTSKVIITTADGRQLPCAILFLPVYQNGAPVNTVAARRAALLGYVFTTLNANDLVQAITRQTPAIGITLYDGTQTDSAKLLYAAPQDASVAPRFASNHVVYFFDHPWTISYNAQPSFRLADNQERWPSAIVVGGVLMYGGLLLVMFAAHRNRREMLRVLAWLRQLSGRGQ